jgi:hypothetical protein
MTLHQMCDDNDERKRVSAGLACFATCTPAAKEGLRKKSAAEAPHVLRNCSHNERSIGKTTMTLVEWNNRTPSHTAWYRAPHRVALIMSAARSATA